MAASRQARTVAAARAQATARRVHGANETAVAAVDEVPYIGFVTRTIAFAIDAGVINLVAVLVGVVVTLVFSVLPTSQDLQKVIVAVGGVVYVLWIIGYFATFWATTGQTPGNRIMQSRVVHVDGSRIKPRQALKREIGVVLSIPLLWGFIPILVTDRRRGVHDWMAGTIVVAAPRDDGDVAGRAQGPAP